MKHNQFCEQIARKASKIMNKYFLNPNLKIQSKTDKTLVTIADLKINKLVIEQVQTYFPTHGVLGEEESYNTDAEYLWVVDPIDGTSMYQAGIPTNVFAIALCKSGSPVISCVYSPYTKQLWLAEKGKSACNGVQIACSDKSFDPEKRILIGVCSEKSSKYNLHKVSEYLCDNLNANVVNLRSTIYMDMLVASGDLAANIAYTNHGYDCIGSHMIESAGGIATTINGENVNICGDNNGYLSSNGVVHDELLRVLKLFEN